MTQISHSQESVNKYEDIFQICEQPGTSIVKTKLIQELVQIERPRNWNREKILTIITELKSIEFHNACLSWTIDKYNKRWKHFQNL